MLCKKDRLYPAVDMQLGPINFFVLVLGPSWTQNGCHQFVLLLGTPTLKCILFTNCKSTFDRPGQFIYHLPVHLRYATGLIHFCHIGGHFFLSHFCKSTHGTKQAPASFFPHFKCPLSTRNREANHFIFRVLTPPRHTIEGPLLFVQVASPFLTCN